jgi:hypothetical protein
MNLHCGRQKIPRVRVCVVCERKIIRGRIKYFTHKNRVRAEFLFPSRALASALLGGRALVQEVRDVWMGKHGCGNFSAWGCRRRPFYCSLSPDSKS